MAQDKRYVGRLLKQINDALQREVNNELRPCGLTLSQMNVLVELHESPTGCLSFKDLESSLGVAQSTIWGLVSRLEQKGCVTTQDSPTDARARHVNLTEIGRELCETAQAQMEEHERRLTSNLTGEETAQLHRYLERVYASLSTYNRAGAASPK